MKIGCETGNAVKSGRALCKKRIKKQAGPEVNDVSKLFSQ